MKKFNLSINETTQYLIPFLLSSVLVITYFISPEFYLTFVLSGLKRESQIVEILTFVSALLSSLIIWKNAYKIRKISQYKFSFLVLIIIGLAAFFFAGEEISWGQTFFKWETPDAYKIHSVETNLHNSPIPINTLGNIFLLSVFVILPIVYNKKHYLSYFQSMKLSIPKKPAIFCIIYAILWRGIKVFYMEFYSKEVLQSLKFYMDFVEQINEQKEMLVSVGLLIYAFQVSKSINAKFKK